MRYFFQWALRGGKSDTLHTAFGDSFEPLERKGQVRAALGGHDGVDLIDDHRIDAAQAGGGIQGQQQIQRLRGGDQDFGWVPAEAASLFLRSVTGTDTDLGLMESDSGLPGHIRDASQRRAQIAFYVNRQGFQGLI